MTFAEHILTFLSGLSFPLALPAGIEVMQPFSDKVTMRACTEFYTKFYADHQHRHMIIGINPGRFGGGVTGIPFTDPIRLQQECGIANDWAKKQELSSLFVYDMIKACGGVDVFYKQFYVTAVSPLGFTSAGKNLNYYDDLKLREQIKPFVTDCLQQQFAFGIHRDKAFCLGDGKNFQFLTKLNAVHHFFDEIVPLPHPRFIMQYRLKRKEEYIDHYKQALGFSRS